jgi:hypothetical protein
MPISKTSESIQRHLRWRQTAVFGTLIAVMAVLVVAAVGVWTGHMAPWIDAELKYKPSATPEVFAVPCPIDPEAIYPDPSVITVHVLNGSQMQGYAASAAEHLETQGFPAPTAGNTNTYDGVVKVISGISGVHNAYTVAQFMPDGAIVTLDWREDASVDVVLGKAYIGMRSINEIAYDPASVIDPLPSCQDANQILASLPTPTPSPSPSPSSPAPTNSPVAAAADILGAAPGLPGA